MTCIVEARNRTRHITSRLGRLNQPIVCFGLLIYENPNEHDGDGTKA